MVDRYRTASPRVSGGSATGRVESWGRVNRLLGKPLDAGWC